MDDFRDTQEDTLEPLGSVSVNGSATGTIEVGGDVDVFAVTLVSGLIYTIDLEGLDGGGGTLEDPYLSLTDADRSLFVYNDDGPVNYDSQLVFTATRSGVHYLYAESFDLSMTGSYALSVAWTGSADDFRDTAADTGKPLGRVSPDNSVSGVIAVGDDVDVFAVTLAAGSTYRIDLRGVAGGGGTLEDGYLSLRNASGILLASNDDGPTGYDAQIEYSPAESGTCYLYARSFDENFGGSYTLAVAWIRAVDEYRDFIGDERLPFGQLATGTAEIGAIGEGGDVDLFAVDLAAGRSYHIDLLGSRGGGGTLGAGRITLLDASGNELLQGTQGNFAGDSRIALTAETSATYYVAARAVDPVARGSYQLALTWLGIDGDDFRDTVADTIEPPGSLAPGESVQGVIGEPGDVDVFTLELSGGTRYTLDLLAMGSDYGDLANSRLTLTDASGEVVAYAVRNGAYGIDSRVSFEAGTTGTYYLLAAAADGGTTGSYVVKARAGTGADDFRDSPADGSTPLGQLVVDTAQVGDIGTAGDVDVFAVDLAAGQAYTIELLGTASGGGSLPDGWIALIDTTGTTLAADTDGGTGRDARTAFTAAASGTHYLQLGGQAGVPLGSYTVRVTLASTLVVAGGAGADSITGGGANDTLDGGGGPDVLDGLLGNDRLLGGSGDDMLRGSEGNDTLRGGGGVDTLDGGAGNDLYFPENALDSLLDGAGVDAVHVDASWTLGDAFEHLALLGTGPHAGTGNAQDNRIAGNAGANALLGLGGNDTLVGWGGRDTLDGGPGKDQLSGGAGDDIYLVDGEDIVLEATQGGVDRVLASHSWTLGAQLEQLELTGADAIDGAGNWLANRLTGNAGANALRGNYGNDTLVGADGTDTLSGGAGNDVLDGGAASDMLVGGGGADRFVFAAQPDADAADTVTDFVHGLDRLCLDASVYSAFTAGTAVTATQLRRGPGVTQADSADQRLVYDTDSGRLFYDADGSGSAHPPVLFAMLDGHPPLAAGDILIIA